MASAPNTFAANQESPQPQVAPANHSLRIPVIAAMVTGLLLRIPTLADPHYYTDEGIFAAVAQRLVQGHVLYTGAWDDKPPFIFWLYALLLEAFGPSMLALRLAAAVAATATGVAIAVLATRLAGYRAGIIAGMLCAVAISTSFVEGNLALTELFGAALAAWGMTLLLLATRRPTTASLVAGALFAAAFMFKQVFALDAIAAGTILLATDRTSRSRPACLVAGFAAVCLVVVTVLAIQGGLAEGLYAVFGFYVLYLGDGSDSHPGRWVVAGLALAVSVIVLRRTSRDAWPLAPITVWLIWTLEATLVGGRPYGHYLIQAGGPLALWVTLLLRHRRWTMPANLLAGAVGLAVVMVTWSFASFFLRDRTVTAAYYANALRLATGVEGRADAHRWYTWRIRAQEELVAAMADDPERTLFVWGEYPWLYPLTGAENPTRFPTSFHLSFVPGSREEAIGALWQRPPRFIVWEGDEWRRLPGLDELLDRHYDLVLTTYESQLYRRR